MLLHIISVYAWHKIFRLKISFERLTVLLENLTNYWVMHPVARVSINIVYEYRNLRTQQMSVLVLL
jgi:hypothetical protein